MARFLLDWEGNIDLKVRQGLVRKSLSKLFSLLCDVNDVVFRLFSNDTYILCSNKDQNEYIQPELSPVIVVGEFSSERLEVDLAMACVIGKDGKYSDCDRDSYYFSQLKHHALSSGDDGSSWLSRMKKLTEKDHSYYSMDFMKNKIKLLEDDADLQGRLQILEYILTRQPIIKLNVLEAIKHRQCGVLRFMVDKSLVQIDSNVSSNQFFKTGASKLQFLDRGRILSSMSTKCFLCFAAVEMMTFSLYSGSVSHLEDQLNYAMVGTCFILVHLWGESKSSRGSTHSLYFGKVLLCKHVNVSHFRVLLRCTLRQCKATLY